jgi:uncharacterized protein (TIGR02466 family)
MVDSSFNDLITRLAVAAFDDFTSNRVDCTADGSTRRRRRKQPSSAFGSSSNLNEQPQTKSTENHNFFEYQRTYGYRLAIPSIASCQSVQQLEEDIFLNACIHYLSAINATTLAQQLSNTSGEFSIDLRAAIQRGNGAHHAFHVHEGAVLSGVYYSSCPLGCAPLVFRRPGAQFNSIGCIPDEDAKEDYVLLHPKEGDLVLFPPWLEHGVPNTKPDSSDRPRVSWPFNLNARLATIGSPWDITRQTM